MIAVEFWDGSFIILIDQHVPSIFVCVGQFFSHSNLAGKLWGFWFMPLIESGPALLGLKIPQLSLCIGMGEILLVLRIGWSEGND